VDKGPRPGATGARRRKRARGFAPEIQIVTGASPDGTPLHTLIYRRLREHVLTGALAPGARLPSARTLASDLGVSRNTVEWAFGQLVAEGFVTRRVGAGSTVAESLAEAVPFARARPAIARETRHGAPGARPPRLSPRGALITRVGRAEIDADRDSGPAATHVAGFPRQTWSRLLARQARRGGVSILGSAPPQGLLELRQQIAEYAMLARGLRCEPDQVLVVSSTQQAIDLAARVLLDPGDDAFVEEPGYPGARAALLAAGAKVHGVNVDDDGLRADLLPAGVSGRRLLYVTPSHQFPLGVTLALARRLAVLTWAREAGAWVLEDDYDSEFRYDGRPLAALHALDSAERVLYVGTYNKVLFPGLRLAYLILPGPLVEPFAAARRISDGYSPPLAQAALADFMASGHFAAYVRQAREHYCERRDLLVARAERAWGDAVRLGPSSTGLHLVAHLAAGVDDRAIARAVEGSGLGVSALSRYYAGPRKPPGLLLSYGAATSAAIARGIDRLTPWLVLS
jgi:GntR family transcriptional regulator / MocR family aminotransferase